MDCLERLNLRSLIFTPTSAEPLLPNNTQRGRLILTRAPGGANAMPESGGRTSLANLGQSAVGLFVAASVDLFFAPASR